MVSLENYYRVREGLGPIENNLLTDRISANYSFQVLFSLIISGISFLVYFNDFRNVKVKKHKKDATKG